MTLRSRQREVDDNVLQFRRELKREPRCAQCRIAMIIIRGEPDFDQPGRIRATYRCIQCGLIERCDLIGRL